MIAGLKSTPKKLNEINKKIKPQFTLKHSYLMQGISLSVFKVINLCFVSFRSLLYIFQ